MLLVSWRIRPRVLARPKGVPQRVPERRRVYAGLLLFPRTSPCSSYASPLSGRGWRCARTTARDSSTGSPSPRGRLTPARSLRAGDCSPLTVTGGLAVRAHEARRHRRACTASSGSPAPGAGGGDRRAAGGRQALHPTRRTGSSSASGPPGQTAGRTPTRIRSTPERPRPSSNRATLNTKAGSREGRRPAGAPVQAEC